MQLICPHCGKPVSSDHINIQRMAAVCPSCDSVFQFEASDTAKAKRRKVKQPPQITVDESEHQLDIAFRTNFRLDKSEGFISAVTLSIIFTFFFVLVTMIFLARPIPILIPVSFGLASFLCFYWLGLMLYNKTKIEINTEQIAVSRQPLRNPLAHTNTIERSGVERIWYEETTASKDDNYDTPRYHVWVEMVDGNRKLLLTDLIEDYAVFLTQRMNEYLEMDAALDVSHLMDEESEMPDTEIADESTGQSASSRS